MKPNRKPNEKIAKKNSLRILCKLFFVPPTQFQNADTLPTTSPVNRKNSPHKGVDCFQNAGKKESFVACNKTSKKERVRTRIASRLSLVRETGLEPVRDYHTPLKRARLPIPPLSQKALRFCNGDYYSKGFLRCQEFFRKNSNFSALF